MFDDDTVTWQLAVMLRTMDICLSTDHMVKLAEEGYDFGDALDEAVAESLVAQQDELMDEIVAHQNMLASDEFTVASRKATIENLMDDFDNFTDRLVEITS
jgi:hypothetical protein